MSISANSPEPEQTNISNPNNDRELISLIASDIFLILSKSNSFSFPSPITAVEQIFVKDYRHE
jgi:hypothetical protein